jgi:hypothetical protein
MEERKQQLDNNKQQQQQQFDNYDPNFDRKLDIITAGATPFVKEHLLTKITRENCLTIIDYVLAMQTEVSPSQTYRIDTILKLKYFAEFHNPKSFKEMIRQDVIDFLDKFRKPESVDPLHKWVARTFQISHPPFSIALLILLLNFQTLAIPTFSYPLSQ